MQKVRVLVTCQSKIVRSGVAAILESISNMEVVGNESAGLMEEAFEQQPDLLVYELSQIEEDFKVLMKLKEICGWTKIIAFGTQPIKAEYTYSLLGLCDGYIQGPIMPGFFIKALELSCYTGYFFFLDPQRQLRANDTKY